MPTRKEIILNGCHSIPLQDLAQDVSRATVTLDELQRAGLAVDKVEYLKMLLVNEDHTAWNNAVRQNTPDAYLNYIRHYPNGLHVAESYAQIAAFEKYYWEIALSTMNEEALNNYKRLYPDGVYINECNDFLNDTAWLEACHVNTIAAYRKYEERNPGRRSEEISYRVYYLQDEIDYNNAVAQGSPDAIYRYLNNYPEGVYREDAQARLDAYAGRDRFLEALRQDHNAFQADEIKMNVDNGVANWDNIIEVLGAERTEALQRFVALPELPESTPPATLQSDSTEVYFWGTPSSGKTCALGSIISSCRRQGIFEGLQCAGYEYMTRLSNIFDSHGYCTLPPSTKFDNIQEMIMNLRDEKGKRHKVSLIDLAGELFRTVYFKGSNRMITTEAQNALDTTLGYLKDKRNNKIHFFVVEYGAEDRVWEGLKMVDYLEKMVSFLREEKVMRTTTVGVYLLVTKCDLIPGPIEDRPRKAYEYIVSRLGSFWNTLQQACELGGVKDLKVLSFSIGDVFAQNLCYVDGSDSDKIIRKLLLKTRGKGGFLDSILNILRN